MVRGEGLEEVGAVLKALREAAEEVGGLAELSRHWGTLGYRVSNSFMSKVLRGVTPPSEAITTPLGYRRRVLYERVRK